MGVMDYFKPVSTWTAQKVREFISENDEGEYNLVDVRQPAEYERGHLPGARLIPVGQLDERVSELDPGKITITYCAAGVRSRAAASLLERAGFSEVHSMTGGINAWRGLVAEGFPEAGISWFSAASSANELTALAWVLEDGTKTFYEKMAEIFAERETAALFRELVRAEEALKCSPVVPQHFGSCRRSISFHSRQVPQETMEGGMRLDDAVMGRRQGSGHSQLSSPETGSYDRYQVLQRRINDENP
jgi:rhodanese-related sulfurtransferase